MLLSATFFMLLLDFSVVSIALPAIERELSMDSAKAQWVISAYTLLFAGFLLVSGRCADLFGRRRFFIAGVAIFTLASLAAGVANDGTTLIVMRALQGVGAAIVNPAALAIVTSLFTGEQRSKAISMWGVIGSAGIAAGMLIGGILVQTLGWRSVFFVNVPVGAIVLALTFWMVQRDGPRDADERLDLAGAATLTAALLLLVFAIVRIGSDGFASIATLARAAGAVALFAIYAFVERKSAAPMIPARIVAYPNFAQGSWIALLQASAYGGVFVFAAMYLQRVIGLNALGAGLAFIPATLMMTLVAGPYANKLIARFGARSLCIFASVLMLVGTVMLAALPSAIPWWLTVMPALLIGAWGCMTTYEISMVAGLGEVAEADEGVASAAVSMASQIGLSLGTAVCAAIDVAFHDLQTVFWGCAAFSIATLVASAYLRSDAKTVPGRFTVGRLRLRIHRRHA